MADGVLNELDKRDSLSLKVAAFFDVSAGVGIGLTSRTAGGVAGTLAATGTAAVTGPMAPIAAPAAGIATGIYVGSKTGEILSDGYKAIREPLIETTVNTIRAAEEYRQAAIGQVSSAIESFEQYRNDFCLFNCR